MFNSVQSFTNWDNIKQSLTKLAEKAFSSEEIISKLIQFKHYSSIARQKNPEKQVSKFQALSSQYFKQLPEIYSKVASFVLKRPNMKVPLFRAGEAKEQILTKEQILYLYCTMLLFLIPQQQFDQSVKARSRYNYLMDFSFIFEEEAYKTVTVMEYIKKQLDNDKNYDQKFLIRRKVQTRSVQQIINEAKDYPMSQLSIEADNASIEDYYGYLKADFANKFIGGGALMSGCVQEEIMFANHPECFTTQLLCEVMQPNEAIQLFGFKKYSKNKGYGWTLEYDGPENHKYQYTTNKMAAEYITAIDAIHFSAANFRQQFTKKFFNRELLKAYVGFDCKQEQIKAVATGNWGCGAFNGDLRLKFLAQWFACSLTKKKMIYCPFGQAKIIHDKSLIEKMKKHTVGNNYNLLCQALQEVSAQNKQSQIYSILDKLL